MVVFRTLIFRLSRQQIPRGWIFFMFSVDVIQAFRHLGFLTRQMNTMTEMTAKCPAEHELR